MKKIIKTLLVVMVLVLALTVLVACDQPQQPTEPEGCKHDCVQEYLPGYDATCTEDGLRPGFKCPDCGEFTKEQAVVPARGHKMADATCTKPQTCTVCAATEGEALGHSFTIEVEAKDAACEEIGYTAHKKCDVCGEPNEDYVEYEALEHNFPEDGYFYYPSAPTCEAGAYIVNVCTICEEMFAFSQEAALGHDIGEDGVCANCGNVLVETAEQLIAALTAGKKVLLTADIELDADVTIKVAGEATLDLGGHKITAVSDQTGSNRNVFNVTGTLTVLNGTITLEHKGENMGWGASTNVFDVTAGGVLNLKDATVKNLGGSDMGFVVHLNNWGEVTLNAENVTFESTYVAIRVFNSGNDMNNVTLTECTVKGVSAAFWVHNYTVADFGTAEKAEAHKALLNLNIYDETNTFEYDGSRAGVIRLGMTNSVYTDAEGNHIHNFAIDVAAKDATCTEAGYTAHKACDCGETEGKEVIPAGHKANAAGQCECGAYVLPEAGVAFKLQLVQVGLNKALYFTGAMDGYYYATSENVADAVDVYIEETEGGFLMYILDGETKNYLYVIQSGTYINVKIGTEPSGVWTFNAELGTLVTNVGGTDYYIGTYGTYNTISASKTSFINASNVNKTQYAARPIVNPAHECDYTEATCTAKATCKICGLTTGDLKSHEYDMEKGVVTDPTCTVAGYTTYKCTGCTATTKGNEVDALGHTTENGTCERCNTVIGGETPAEPVTESFSIIANKGVLSGTVITWTSSEVTFKVEKGSNNNAIRTSDSDHFRVYQGNNVTISANGGKITKVVITCTSSDYAAVMKTSLTNKGYTATVSGSVVTVTVDNVETITFSTTAQTRMNKIAVTYTK